MILAAIPVLCALQFTGCGDPPQPIDTPKGSPHETQAYDVAGKVVFEGPEFDAPTGTLFVSVRPKGTRMPWLSQKYGLGSGAITKGADGVKSLAFALDPTKPSTFNSSPGQNPSVECEIAASYKENADALSTTRAEAVVPYEAGKRDYVLTLKLP